ncbi:MAG: MmcQ/YjbR family DNA-binding protein [Dysgonamonadaceae bacterium]|jgi:predicted DNA-binding protein (MmcQ/YjbR family)|nr:MmcQ/YjbR family DNA-binding protein [Dysgonamonadaceae bacterium]
MASTISIIKGIHPGIILEREVKLRGLKKGRFSISINEFPQTLVTITKGKCKMNPALSLKIERAFGIEEGFEYKYFVKCNPAQAIDLRERYNCVEPAWHFNKKYWNSIVLNQDMDDETVRYWIRHSVDEVILKLPKKE